MSGEGWDDLWADVHRATGRRTARDLVALLRRDRAFRAIATARACQRHARRSGGAIAGRLLRRTHRWAAERAGMDLPWEAEIGPGLAIAHGWGLVVSPDARIGANVTLFHGVTLGRKDEISPDGGRVVGGAPTLGDGVWIGPHALVLGPVTVGPGSRVAGGAVVAKDVPERSLVAGNPASVIRSDVPPDTPNAAPLDPDRRALDRRGS